MENSSVCSGGIKGEGSTGPYSVLLGQEKCIKIFVIQRLGILILSTDISWKARAGLNPP